MAPIPLHAASATLHYPDFLSHCLQRALASICEGTPVLSPADGAPEWICWFVPPLENKNKG